MKLEIKTKCSTCDEEMHHLVERGLKETLLYTDPCPNCNPAKPEKITPKKGETVEVRFDGWLPGVYNTRKATGKRSANYNKVKIVSPCEVGRGCYDQWRYPGETEWRD